MLALEAFDLAADLNQFPEQLDKVKPWQTTSIFWNTSYWFYGSVERMDAEVAKAPNQYLKIDVNQYLPLVGKTGVGYIKPKQKPTQEPRVWKLTSYWQSMGIPTNSKRAD